MGLPYPAIGWSWEELLEAAEGTASVVGEEVTGYGLVDIDAATTVLLKAEQQAGPLLDLAKEPPEVHLDDPAMAEALGWYLEVANFPKAGVAPYPGEEGPVSAVSAWAYFVSAGTAQTEAAYRWIEFLSHQDLGRLEGQIRARWSVAEESRFWEGLEPGLAEVLRHCLDNATALPRTLVWAVRKGMGALGEGQPLEVALAVGQAEAQRLLGQAVTVVQAPAPTITVVAPTPEPTRGKTAVRFLAHPGARAIGYEALASEFEKSHPDIDIRVDDGWRVPSIEEKIASADCFVALAAELVVRGTDGLLPLDPFIEQSGFGLDPFYPSLLEQARLDGHIWGIPLDTDAMLLYCNRDLFDAAGAPYPDATWNAEAFVERAIAMSDRDAAEPTYGFRPCYGAFPFLPNYIAWLGGQLLTETGEPNLDDPTVAQAMSRFAELVLRATPPEELVYENVFGLVSTYIVAGRYPEEVAKGRVAMWTEPFNNHLWAPAAGFEVGVAPLPTGATLAERLFPDLLYISADTQVAQACWEWISFLSAQPQAVVLLPARRDVAQGEEWRRLVGEEVATAWDETVARSQEQQLPNPLGADILHYWLNEAFVEVLAGRDVSAALDDAQEKSMVVYTCLAEGESTIERWQACAREADPQVRLPPAQQ